MSTQLIGRSMRKRESLFLSLCLSVSLFFPVSLSLSLSPSLSIFFSLSLSFSQSLFLCLSVSLSLSLSFSASQSLFLYLSLSLSLSLYFSPVVRILGIYISFHSPVEPSTMTSGTPFMRNINGRGNKMCCEVVSDSGEAMISDEIK